MVNDALSLPGLEWHANGQCTLSGELLEVFRRLDREFMRLAALTDAEEHRFPSFIAASVLQRMDYFASFPHLATYPVTLDDDPENLSGFAQGEPIDPDGCLHLTRLSPLRDVLTPAACYHCYPRVHGENLEVARYMTTLATCYRREVEYKPLQRQWSFSMREIVCIGSAEEVQVFLAAYRERVAEFAQRLGLRVSYEQATDPFFNPKRNPKYVAQKLDPLKTELLVDGLAIASLNFHRDYFGEAFTIQRAGTPADTGCVAFGLERWLFALFATYGADLAQWPRIEAT